MKQSEKKVSKLQKEKKELITKIQALESRVKEATERRMDVEDSARENSKMRRGDFCGSNCGGHKKKRKGGSTGRIRAVSSGSELEVHATF